MITKTGAEMVKSARLSVNSIKKPFELAYRGVRGPLKGVSQATAGAGKFVGKKPSVGIPAVGTAVYGAYKFTDEAQKKYLHTDPQMDVTERTNIADSSPKAPGIEYSNPQYKKHFKNRNLIY